MTDDDFKRLLYKKLEEDKKNERVLTHRLYSKQTKEKIINAHNLNKPKSK